MFWRRTHAVVVVARLSSLPYAAKETPDKLTHDVEEEAWLGRDGDERRPARADVRRRA